MSNPETNNTDASMEAFFTRERANEGIKLPLARPDGTETEHYIKIRGIDSDAYQRAAAESKREMFKLITNSDKAPTPDEIEEATRAGQIKILSALVIGWSFKEECTPENVAKLLRNAPQITNEIDKLAARRSLFFKKGSAPSTPTLEVSSS